MYIITHCPQHLTTFNVLLFVEGGIKYFAVKILHPDEYDEINRNLKLPADQIPGIAPQIQFIKNWEEQESFHLNATHIREHWRTRSKNVRMFKP